MSITTILVKMSDEKREGVFYTDMDTLLDRRNIRDIRDLQGVSLIKQVNGMDDKKAIKLVMKPSQTGDHSD